MRVLFLVALYSVQSFLCYSQISRDKPVLDSFSINSWPKISTKEAPCISSDGKYILFFIENVPLNNQTLSIQSSDGRWKSNIVGASTAFFSNDNKNVIFTKENYISILNLKSKDTSCIKNVVNPSFFSYENSNFFTYQSTTSKDVLYIHDINKLCRVYQNVHSYKISGNSRYILLERHFLNNGRDRISLVIIDLNNYFEKIVWEGSDLVNVMFSSIGNVLIQTKSVRRDEGYTCISYGVKNGNIDTISTLKLEDSGKIWEIRSIERFSQDGCRLFCNLSESKELVNNDTCRSRIAIVRSYLDKSSKENTLLDSKAQSVLCTVSIEDKQIVKLQDVTQRINVISGLCDTLALLTETEMNNPNSLNYFLVSTVNGVKIQIPYPLANPEYKAISPSGKFLILKNPKNFDYYSFNIFSKENVNITEALHIPIVPYLGETGGPELTKNLRICSWLSNKNTVLIYDMYDIWSVDLDNNLWHSITNNIGQEKKIAFSYIGETGVFEKNTLIDPTQNLVLAAFDKEHTLNGFYKTTTDSRNRPVLLTMDTCVYFIPNQGIKWSFKPLKAINDNTWLVWRSNKTNSPNLFITHDFIKFKAVSEVHPEKYYNWFSTEILKFKTLDGKMESGILYKPENFDSSKKYPIIFHYYESVTQRYLEHIMPDFTVDNINIPWFVSRGYIVFTPDISYVWGKAGDCAFNSVVGAARHLSKYSYVDSSKMGLQGHSWGGYETNYIVTHSNMFRAAMSSSARAEIFSMAFESPDPSTLVQQRMNKTIWEDFDSYAVSCPILLADKVNTPLLLMSNKLDGAVPYRQGIIFFTALSYLKKRVWLLEYEGEGHSLVRKDDAIEHTIRINQFFDHYLKGALPPLWMTRKANSFDSTKCKDNLDIDLNITTPPNAF
jgi:dienelactone hydrolase